jgi:PAS domain-containing protein
VSALRARCSTRHNDGHSLLDALLDSLQLPVLACAHDCRLTHANAAARELIGVEECVIGTRPETWIPLLRPRMLSGIAMPSEDLPPVRALAGEVVRGVDVLVRIGDCDAVLQVAARPALDRRGRPRGAIVLLEDVAFRA